MTEVRQGPTSHVLFREVSAKRELTEQAFLALAGSYRAQNVLVSVFKKNKFKKKDFAVACGFNFVIFQHGLFSPECDRVGLFGRYRQEKEEGYHRQ